MAPMRYHDYKAPSELRTSTSQLRRGFPLKGRKKVNYRKFGRASYRAYYEDYYGIDLPSNFDVHHIDGNRENNKIENLVAIPHELHQLYHTSKNDVQMYPLSLEMCGNRAEAKSYAIAAHQRFLSVLQECSKWIDYRDFLGGKIPNIHGIRLTTGVCK